MSDNKKLESDIELFFSFFHEQLENIVKSKFEFGDRTCKSILLFSLIDSVSNVIYKEKTNREKFVSFIDNYSGWQHKNRVSIVQLYYFLQEKSKIKSVLLYELTSKKMSSLRSGLVIRPSFDLFLSEIEFEPENEKIVKMFLYSELLYKYRNVVTHEFKIPGHGMQFANDNDIYYHSLSHSVEELKANKHTWELVYPINYISILVNRLLENTRKYCIENSINPYNNYYYGEVWGQNNRHITRNSKRLP